MYVGGYMYGVFICMWRLVWVGVGMCMGVDTNGYDCVGRYVYAGGDVYVGVQLTAKEI